MGYLASAFNYLKTLVTDHILVKVAPAIGFLIISDNSEKALLAFMILFSIDTVCGVIRSIKFKVFSSKILRTRLFNKLFAYLVVLIGSNMLVYIDPMFDIFRRFIIFFLASTEMISILENVKTAVYNKLPSGHIINKLLSILKEKTHA
ncbi:MAG: phage holin family protein [Nanoarchaeota archaeon]|nr:phage holin family protein [Nanoarchaeota archaeon]